MKKTLLALAVSALSVNAFAAPLDYKTGAAPVVVNTIAKEVVGVSGGALTTTDTVQWNAGFSTTNQNLVRIDLSNGAKFTAAPTLTVNTLTSTISAGGQGESYAVFQLNGAATEAASAAVTLAFAGLTAVNQGDIGVQYRLYSTQFDAANATTNTVANGSFPYATFANGLVFSADATAAAVSKQIDVTKESKKFANNTLISAPFGGLNLSVKANTFGADLGTPLTLDTLVGATPVITVSGDFSATDGTPANLKLGAIGATTIAADKKSATFTLPTAPIPALTAANSALTYQVNGTTAIAPSAFNAKLALGTAAALTAAPAEVVGFANLGKNGATAEVDLALKPGGVFSNYVRISNKSGIAGDVFITVINDAGQSATVSLGEVAGQTSNNLAAGASTTQMSIQDIFNAAATKGLAIANEGKLRLNVEAQITEGKLSVQTYTVATDGTTFSTF
ncbi:hypothetical protein [Stutzerimonas nitrititolerans]|uniref:hypothetical protein n=1 Tax=Stutzerimonas nitrititolerans TaxID=2482751 RepID=UPI00289FE9E1|nr:hypothetical protein [Stutzerimonas nitrititolerans]